MPRVLNIKDLDYEVPRGAIYIGRPMPRYGLAGSKWANPFKPQRHTREEHERVVAEYMRHWLYATPENRAEAIAKFKLRVRPDIFAMLINDVHELRGLDLVCWCVPLPCHGDVLLRLANGRR
jgi:hypothetical protein